jgi:uncharacterized membrane protein
MRDNLSDLLYDEDDEAPRFPDDEVERGKSWAILSYIFFLFVVPYFAARDNRFAMYHARQGLLVFFGWMIVAVLAYIFDQAVIIKLLYLVPLGLMLLGMSNAASGKAERLPIVGDLARRFS